MVEGAHIGLGERAIIDQPKSPHPRQHRREDEERAAEQKQEQKDGDDQLDLEFEQIGAAEEDPIGDHAGKQEDLENAFDQLAHIDFFAAGK